MAAAGDAAPPVDPSTERSLQAFVSGGPRFALKTEKDQCEEAKVKEKKHGVLSHHYDMACIGARKFGSPT